MERQMANSKQKTDPVQKKSPHGMPPNSDSKKKARCMDPVQWQKDLMTLQRNYYNRWRHFYG